MSAFDEQREAIADDCVTFLRNTMNKPGIKTADRIKACALLLKHTVPACMSVTIQQSLPVTIIYTSAIDQARAELGINDDGELPEFPARCTAKAIPANCIAGEVSTKLHESEIRQ